MDFDRVEQIWKHQPDAAALPSDDDLVRRVAARHRSFRRHAAIRDIIELGASAIVAAGLVGAAVRAPVRWPWIAAALLTAAVTAVFVRERLRGAPPALPVLRAAGLRDGLQEALAETDRQIRFLGSVVWWYLLPLASAVVLILAGTVLGARASMDPAAWAGVRAYFWAASGAVLLATGGLYWLIWRANARAVRHHLLPHREGLADLIRDLSAAVDEREPAASVTRRSPAPG